MANHGNSDQITDQKRFENLCEKFVCTNHNLLNLKTTILEQLKEASIQEEPSKSNGFDYMITFIQDLPCGCEHGTYIILNWRIISVQIMLVRLRGENKPIVDETEMRIPENTNNAMQIFDQIVEKLVFFLKHKDLEREQLPLILTTTHPVHNTSIRNGSIISNKDQAIKLNKNMQNVDVHQLLKESLNRSPSRVHVDIVAVANDVSAAFLNCVSIYRNCHISIQMNNMMVAYWDRIRDIRNQEIDPRKSNVLINLLISNYGELGELNNFITSLDMELDPNLQKTPTHVLEKLISSEFITELIRLLMLQAIDEGLLFHGVKSQTLDQYGTIKLSNIDEILNEHDGPYYDTVEFLERLGFNAPSKEDCKRVHTIMMSVIHRSVDLLATIIAAIIEHIEKPSIMISIDGTISDITIYPQLLTNKIQELLRTNCDFELIKMQDNEGRGAALIGSMALQDNFIYKITEPM